MIRKHRLTQRGLSALPGTGERDGRSPGSGSVQFHGEVALDHEQNVLRCPANSKTDFELAGPREIS